MESGYSFYIKYGKSFPNSGRVVNEPLMDKWFEDRNKIGKASQILHMKQFNKAFKVPMPPGQDWMGWRGDPFDKYNRSHDPNYLNIWNGESPV